MNAEVQQLFYEVADLPPQHRQQYFLSHSVPEPVQKEVESLLAFDREESQSLAAGLWDSAVELLSEGEPRCGAWRLDKLLGRGGMGAVYLAHRDDGEVRLQAAAKLIPFADANLRDRFLRERQILASLNHPHIARLLDAGHREDGQPFLVMEYVDGAPIDTFAERLSVREKIRIFVKVCDAVSYAHRNLVIHRDLKPSNILIIAGGEPKLLDFGIAKVLDGADQTQTVERFLTPGYSSPEQVRGGMIGTAADVYSLGAILYRLLTGFSPHDPDADSTGTAKSGDPWEKIILEQQPKRPGAFHGELPRDLDFIVLKALRKDPAERYTSVEQLSEDLLALLESRPVRARAAGVGYRVRKFVRRHWGAVAAASLVAAGLVVGLYTLNRERNLAQRRFVQVRQLANKLLDIDGVVQPLSGGVRARQMIVDTSLEYLAGLYPDARKDPGLALELGNAYIRVARVQGVPIGSTLGQLDKAEESLRRAEALIEPVLAAQPQNRIALLRSGQIAHDRMILAGQGSRGDETAAFARKSADRLDKLASLGKPSRSEAGLMLTYYQNVGVWFNNLENFDEAVRYCRKALDLAREQDLGARPGMALSALSVPLRSRGDLEEALQAADEAVRILEPPAGGTDEGRMSNFILALGRKGGILSNEGISLGRPAEAVPPLERAFQLSEELARRDPNDASSRGHLAYAGNRLAGVLRDSDPQRALAIYDHTVLRLGEIQSNRKARRDEVKSLAGSTYPLRSLGRVSEAKQRLDAAFARLKQLKAYPQEKIDLGSEAEITVRALADLEAGDGNVARALEIYRKLLAQVLAAQPKPETLLQDAADLSRLYETMVPLYRRSGHVDEASALETKRLELWQQWDRKLPKNAFVLRKLASPPR